MKTRRHAVLAAASLLAAAAMTPTVVKADDQQPPGKQGHNKPNGKDGKGARQGQRQPGKQNQGQQKNFGQQQNRGAKKPGAPAVGQRPAANAPQRKFGGNAPAGNPNALVKPKPPAAQQPPINRNAVTPQKPQPRQPAVKAGQQNLQNRFGNHGQVQKPQGQQGWTQRPAAVPGVKPAPTAHPAQANTQGKRNFGAPNRPPQSAADAKRRFEALRGQRKQVKIDGGKGVVIEEPGQRRIIRDKNRVVITHDDNERLRRVAPHARFEKGKGGNNIAVIDRPGGYKIYSETDAHGQLIRRYRRGPDGRDVIIIDNRRRRHDNTGRNIAAGIGIGVGIVAGAAILNSVLDVPPPRVTIPRDEYIVDYDRASDEDVYDALSAPPVENFRDRYTLDEIRATAALRDRMRRVDLDDITFDFGSWEVNPDEYEKLDRIARAMRRIIDRNPNEVFMIEGYTDAVGSIEDNLSLSDRRAESVAEVLTEQFGVPFENLTTQGYGEDYLKVPTDGPERLNRRVAVRRITPLLSRGGPQD